ncbi:MAG: hypothetical protein CL994_05145 [Euryarchaeota archaeon]|nr:hypothetical protein [Euryarchaeota archaeon]
MRYVTRTEWGATPPAKPFSRLRPSRVVGIVLHHSGVKNGPSGEDAVRAYERFHMKTRGWRGIAYNWLISDGVLYEGRGAGVISGATKGWNSRTESICYAGWGSAEVAEENLRLIRAKVEEIQARYGGKLWVKPHSKLGSTSCPGSYLTSWLQQGMPVNGVVEETTVQSAAVYLESIKEQVARRPLSRRRRSRGEAVRVVQERLAERGFDPGPVDGIWGRKTTAALKQFQRSQGYLKPDGVCGVRTFHALFLQ